MRPQKNGVASFVAAPGAFGADCVFGDGGDCLEDDEVRQGALGSQQAPPYSKGHDRSCVDRNEENADDPFFRVLLSEMVFDDRQIFFSGGEAGKIDFFFFPGRR